VELSGNYYFSFTILLIMFCVFPVIKVGSITDILLNSVISLLLFCPSYTVVGVMIDRSLDERIRVRKLVDERVKAIIKQLQVP